MGTKTTKQNDPATLTNEDIQLLLDNTLYDQETIKQWHKSFLIDCPDGKLDKNTLMKAYKACYPSEKRDKLVGQIFRTFDTDNSGYIDFVEFLVALSITSHGYIEDKLKLAFDIYDINKNGYVDKKEMSKILNAIYDLIGNDDRSGQNDPKKRVEAIMTALDKNHDQKISRGEFVFGCMSDETIKNMLTPVLGGPSDEGVDQTAAMLVASAETQASKSTEEQAT